MRTPCALGKPGKQDRRAPSCQTSWGETSWKWPCALPQSPCWPIPAHNLIFFLAEALTVPLRPVQSWMSTQGATPDSEDPTGLLQLRSLLGSVANWKMWGFFLSFDLSLRILGVRQPPLQFIPIPPLIPWAQLQKSLRIHDGSCCSFP